MIKARRLRWAGGGLGVKCSPRDPRFAGSNPAEVDEFFQDVKLLSSGRDFKLGGLESEISVSLKNLKSEKIGENKGKLILTEKNRLLNKI